MLKCAQKAYFKHFLIRFICFVRCIIHYLFFGAEFIFNIAYYDYGIHNLAFMQIN